MMENKEILTNVLDRAHEIKRRKNAKKRTLYCITCFTTSFIIILSISAFIPNLMHYMDATILSNNSNMGSIFINSTYLGYIIIGFFSFILGAIVTLVCYKSKDSKEDDL
ncbi:MAG: hypothetical protein R3Y47_00855 [Lachnospiraceae bacterium]